MRGIFFFCLFSIIYSQSGLEIAKLLNERSMPISMSSKISMTLTNSKNKTRKSVMISKFTNRNKYQLIWVLEPKSDRGMSFLKKSIVTKTMKCEYGYLHLIKFVESMQIG